MVDDIQADGPEREPDFRKITRRTLTHRRPAHGTFWIEGLHGEKNEDYGHGLSPHGSPDRFLVHSPFLENRRAMKDAGFWGTRE